MARCGSDGGQLGDQAAAHRVAHEHGLAGCRGGRAPGRAARRSSPCSAPPVGRPEGAAVAGGVDGDDLEAEVDQAGQGLGVEDPLGREAVDDHQRHAPAADRHADLVAVGQRDRVAGQPGQGDVDLVVEVRPGADDRIRGQRQVAHRRRAAAGLVAVVLVPDLDRFPALVRRHGPSLADPRART